MHTLLYKHNKQSKLLPIYFNDTRETRFHKKKKKKNMKMKMFFILIFQIFINIVCEYRTLFLSLCWISISRHHIDIIRSDDDDKREDGKSVKEKKNVQWPGKTFVHNIYIVCIGWDGEGRDGWFSYFLWWTRPFFFLYF